MQWRSDAARMAVLPLALVALTMALPSAASADAFIVMDGPKQGFLVYADEDGSNLNGSGKVVPQSNGCNYTFDGSIHGEAISSCVTPGSTLGLIYVRLATAIHDEEGALFLIKGTPSNENLAKAATFQLDPAVSSLNKWQETVAASTLPGGVKNDLSNDGSLAAELDGAAAKKLRKAKGKSGNARAELIDDARAAIGQALGDKREAFAEVIANVPIDGTVPTGAGSLPAPIDLTGGAALSLDGTSNLRVTGAHGFGTASPQGFLWQNGSASDVPGGQPSVAYGYGPNGSVMGEWQSSAAYWNGVLGPFAKITSAIGSVRAANDFGGVGFLEKGGDEVATWFRENYDGADPGFKPVAVNTPGTGSASFFTVNYDNRMWGDYFYDMTHFRAFAFDPRGEELLKLFVPDDGSSQPRASNDLMAAGGVVNSDSSIEGAYWLGKKHYLPYTAYGQNTLINGLNEGGVAVGQIGSGMSTDAALFANGQVYNLNTLIPGGSGWDLNKAYDIDDGGNIVGTGTVSGVDHAFLIRGGTTVDNDLQLVKEVKGGDGAAHNEFQKGKTVHFVLTLTNHGPQEARDVKVTDHVPKHCKFNRVNVDPDKVEKQATKQTPGKGEDGGDVTVTFGKPLKVGAVVKIHVFCTASVTAQETFTNKSEVSTNPSQKEPASDPHPNMPNVDYILKP